jgi:hypothetical protein
MGSTTGQSEACELELGVRCAAAAAAKQAVKGSSSQGDCASRPTCMTPCTPGAQPSSRAMGSMATLQQQECGKRDVPCRAARPAQRQLCMPCSEAAYFSKCTASGLC